MKRIVFGTRVSEKHLVRTREIAPDWEIVTTGGPEGTRDKIGGAEIYVDWAYNFYREIIERADQVKWIQSLSAGVDRTAYGPHKGERDSGYQCQRHS